MRIVGHRKERQISFSSSQFFLEEGAQFNDELHRMPSGDSTAIRKGVCHFRTHEEANRHQNDCSIAAIAQFARCYHRATTDIDLLVPANRESVERIKQARMILPDQAARDIDPAWFEEGKNIRIADAFVVDIIMNACGETFEPFRRFAEVVDLDGLPIRTINLEGVLLTKQTTRDKDIADRIVLERALLVRQERPRSSLQD